LLYSTYIILRVNEACAFCLSPITTFFQENASVSSSLPENRTLDSLALFCSEKAVQESLHQPLQGIDEHLVEFSGAMRSKI